MKKYRIFISMAIIIMFLTMTVAHAQTWRTRQTKDRGVTVFMAADDKSNQTGFGVAFSKNEFRNVSELSYVDFDEFKVTQFSRFQTQSMGPFGTNLGFSLGYANAKSGSDAPNGFVSGLSLTLGSADLSSRIGLDIRASSLSEGFNPTRWITNPDILYAGAGVTFRF